MLIRCGTVKVTRAQQQQYYMVLELMMENPYAMVAAVERLRANLLAVQIEPSEEDRRLYGR